MQFFFDAQQLLRFFFFDRSDGNAGPAADHILDVLPADNAGGGFIEVVFFAKGAQVLALLAFLVRIEARLLELVVRDGVLHTVDDELDALLDLGQLFGKRGLAQFHARSSFVDQIDGLVWKKAIGNIAIGMRHGKIDGLVGVGDGVKFFVTLFNSEKNFYCVGFVWRRNFYRLKAALERSVFFNRLAILRWGSSPDALNLAARQGGLQNVGCVERAFR